MAFKFSFTLVYALALAIAITSPVGAFSPSPIKVAKASSDKILSTSTLSATTAALASSITIAVPPTYALFGRKAQPPTQPLFSIPSIFNSVDSRPIVLFDGKCNLCNAGVQLILDTDRASSDSRGNLRVAALQSRVGKILLARLPPGQRKSVLNLTTSGKEGKEYKSIVVAGQHQAWLNSAACIRIGKELKGPLRYIALLASIIPSFIRDAFYKLFSRYRTKLFGKAAECRLWDDNWDTRFVDDGLFGGRSEEDDMFADPNAVKEEVDDDDDDDDVEEAPVGSPSLKIGDSVRVVASKPILHTHVSGFEAEGGLCSVGLVGTVTRVLGRPAYPKNVVVEFNAASESPNFSAHFFPGQLRQE